jgi:hypothetical protein
MQGSRQIPPFSTSCNITGDNKNNKNNNNNNASGPPPNPVRHGDHDVDNLNFTYVNNWANIQHDQACKHPSYAAGAKERQHEKVWLCCVT